MTRQEFLKKAAREEEKRLQIPGGWWGTWRDIHGPDGIRVKFSGNCWTLSQNGVRISRHDSRSFAIGKARSKLRPASEEAR